MKSLFSVGAISMQKFRKGIAVLVLVFFCLALNTGFSDITFTQDTTATVTPDVQDLFYSPSFIRFPATWSNSNIAIDNPPFFNLLDGDNIDGIHHELRRADGDGTVFFPAFVFSVDVGALGQPGTPVSNLAPNNAAEFFESDGFTQSLVATSASVGLTSDSDVDGFMLTPLSEINVNNYFYISLAPGSPTLAAIGASPGDILAVSPNTNPVVAITAAQLGLLATDDVDGFVMVDGVDANGDGDFDDPGDGFPIVVFTVSPNSQGQFGSGVAMEQLIDGPVGGDIYWSLSIGQNFLFQDDAVLGLADFDDMNGLDLASLAVPEGTMQNGLIPSGTPFSGGVGGPGTTGGGPGTGPGGGPGGGVPCLRFGLCVSEFSNDKCDLEISVDTTCMPRVTKTVRVCCDNGDGSDGSEVTKAVQSLVAALMMIRAPCGTPLFTGATLNSFPPGSASPTHVNASMAVNPALAMKMPPCSVTGIFVSTVGCPCYTQNLRPKPFPAPPRKCTVIVIDTFKDNPGGVYMLQLAQDDNPYFFEVEGGTATDAKTQLLKGLVNEGFKADFDKLRRVVIECIPGGLPCEEVWGAGFVEGGNGNQLLGMEWKPLNKVDPDIINDSDN